MPYITLMIRGDGAAALACVPKGKRRIELSRGEASFAAPAMRVWRAAIAALLPDYEYDEERFFASDAAPADIVARRRAGFERLTALYRSASRETQRS